jgi:hypothetical protein
MINQKLPPNLNDVAQLWREYFEAIPFTVSKILDKHILDKHSVYVLQILFQREAGASQLVYVGRTRDPSQRANDHKSELKRCKATTFIGKSVIYNSDVMQGVQSIDMILTVACGGLTDDESKIREKELTVTLKSIFSDDIVITRPTGKKI